MSETLRLAFNRVLGRENRRRVPRAGRLETVADAPRQLTVYLPAGYDERATRRYPVLFMQDGQNLFEEERAFGGHPWHIDAAADAAIGERKACPMIIVGIDHAGDKRIDEYTPTRDIRKRQGGGGDAYARMVIDEIKPLVDARYRTQPQASAIGGSSLGGLIALHIVLARPDVFSAAAIMSPSVWWNGRAILEEIDVYSEPQRPRLWLDVGGREGREALMDVQRLRDHLLAKGWHEPGFHYYEDRRADHSERAWGARVGKVLEFLFPPE